MQIFERPSASRPADRRCLCAAQPAKAQLLLVVVSLGVAPRKSRVARCVGRWAVARIQDVQDCRAHSEGDAELAQTVATVSSRQSFVHYAGFQARQDEAQGVPVAANEKWSMVSATAKALAS